MKVLAQSGAGTKGQQESGGERVSTPPGQSLWAMRACSFFKVHAERRSTSSKMMKVVFLSTETARQPWRCKALDVAFHGGGVAVPPRQILLSMPIHTPWQQWIGPKLRSVKPKMPTFHRPQVPAYYFYKD